MSCSLPAASTTIAPQAAVSSWCGLLRIASEARAAALLTAVSSFLFFGMCHWNASTENRTSFRDCSRSLSVVLVALPLPLAASVTSAGG
ncbi:hypothetical protein QBC40DRAFT_290972 [Triangularia verruculosa]|uniref:Uncharacterized protein n=1 Tax=Triangularia verruculosa TaxID=2587418 RepID=A0AAN6X921_9PEZI|nr:hypothetical protein QBC40DRAFT_290972 [Triangularia verruculosa]